MEGWGGYVWFGKFGLVYLFWLVWFGFGKKKIGLEKVLLKQIFNKKNCMKIFLLNFGPKKFCGPNFQYIR